MRRMAWFFAGGLGAAVLLWGGQALANHRAGQTLHACITGNNTLKAGETCGRGETAVILVTEGALTAVESRLASLEAANQSMATRVGTLESKSTSLEAANANLSSKVETLESKTRTLEGKVAALESANSGLQSLLNGVSRGVDVTTGVDTLTFRGMNLQLVNGQGATSSTTGTGNLIIGYNHTRTLCDPAEEPPGFCVDQRRGSHNLVIGDAQNYTSFGGVVGGSWNSITGPYASVTGGRDSSASGESSWVGGGVRNFASGLLSSVSGGGGNNASGVAASISGGSQNTASELYSAVSGGWGNTASAYSSTVSGGTDRTAGGNYDWVAGGLFQDA